MTHDTLDLFEINDTKGGKPHSCSRIFAAVTPRGGAGSAATSGIPTPPPLPRLGLRIPPRAPRTSRQVSGIVRAPQSTNRIFANQEPRAAATLSSNTKQHSPELTQNHRAKSRHPAPRACILLQSTHPFLHHLSVVRRLLICGLERARRGGRSARAKPTLSRQITAIPFRHHAYLAKYYLHFV